jgi:hypothetical protein
MESNNDGFEKIDIGLSDTWDPEAADAEKEITGKLIEIRDGVGPNNSMMYQFEMEDGSKKLVWGCSVLNSKLKNVELGNTCKLIFLGRQQNKSNTGKPYKNFDVYVKHIQ